MASVVVVGMLLFFFVIRDDFSRYLRIVAAGVVFCVCLIGSIYFGMPAAIVAAAANLSGMVVAGKMFAGTHDWYYLSIVVFQATTAVASLVIALLADLEREKKYQHQRAALTDPVTEVYNPRYFKRRLEEEIERSARTGAATSILYIDLDSFKRINDDFGHDAGDMALRLAAEFIQRTVRLSDVVCRNGGDEFAVILPETASEIADSVGKRVQDLYPRHMKSNEGLPVGMALSLSIGVSAIDGEASADALMKEADDALYRDKRSRGKERGR